MAQSIRELAAARLQKASKSGGNIDYSKIKFKPEVGKDYQVRLLPNKYSEYPIQELEIHQYDTFGKSVVALSSYGESDPIVKFKDKLWKDFNKAKAANDENLPEIEKETKYASSKLTPKKRYFAQVIVRGEESKGPIIWEFGATVAKAIDSLLVQEDYEDLVDVTNGTDLTVTGVEASMLNKRTGKVTTYTDVTITPRRKASVLDKDEDLVEKWLEDQKDPATTLYKAATYAELKEMLEKFITPEDEDEDDAPKAPVRKVAPLAPEKAPSKRVEESEEEEEEETPPAKVAPKKAKKPVVEEIEEEEDDETDDLPFKAPKKSTAKKPVVDPDYNDDEEDELSEAIPKVKGKAPVAKPAPAKKATSAPKFNSALFEADDDDDQ